MSSKQRRHAGGPPPARPNSEEEEIELEGKDKQPMSPFALAPQTQNPRPEGIAVVGEAVRRFAPESAEFLMEITATAPTAAQAIRDNHLKTTQVTQAVSSLGAQTADLQTISLNVYNVYQTSPWAPALPAFGNTPQISPGAFPPYPAGAAQSLGAAVGAGETQIGSYLARNTVRVT